MINQPMCACITSRMTYQYGSSEYQDMLGWQGELNGVALADIHKEDALFELRHGLMLAKANGTAQQRWQPFNNDNSLWLQLEICWNPGAELFIVNAYTNQQANAQELLQHPEQGLFSYTPQAVMLLDDENRIYRVNRSFSEMSGYNLEDVIGEGPGIVTNREIAPELFDHLWQQLMLKGVWEGLLWNRHKDGRNYPAWYSITANRDQNSEITGFVAQFSDITSSFTDSHRYLHTAYDSLTGLADEQMLLDFLDQKLLMTGLNQQNCGLLLIHPEEKDADSAITEIATRLSMQLREQDLLAIDHHRCFALVVEPCNDDTALEQLAERLRFELQEPADGTCYPVAISGVLADRAGITAELMLDRAYLALDASRQDQNRFRLYEEGLGSGTILSRQELQQAITENWLQLRFNPVYSLQGHKLTATEMALCLDHPLKGLLTPDQFVIQLTRYGLLHEFQQQLLKQVEPLLTIWAGFDSLESLSLELQDEELLQSSYITELLQMMLKAGMPPQRLMISVSIAHLKLYPDEIEQLKAQGVRLLLDTEKRKQATIPRSLAPDMMLLNPELVEEQMRDDKAAIQIERVLQQAETLDIQVQASGVRTTGQMARLTQQGCHLMSGKYVGWFLTLEQLIERLDLEH